MITNLCKSLQVPTLGLCAIKKVIITLGPESAGAHPGPVCYKKGGPLTITDANLCLGRLLPDFFPKIFGDSENDPLDTKASVKAFTKLTKEVNKYLLSNPDNAHNKAMSIEEVAMGFLRVANEAMCRPIRALTEARGYDTSRHVLACFGGAGGQHACSIARSLGMKTVFVHRYAGILSAYGMALADVVHEAQEPCAATYGKDSFSRIDERIDELKKDCFQQLHEQGFKKDQIHLEPYLHLRYKGTDCALMCPGRGNPATGDSSKHGDFRASFLDRYQREFGFTIPERDIIVDDIRVRGVGSTGVLDQPDIPHATGEPVSKTKTKCYFEDGYLETSVYLLEELQAGHKIHGPAIIMNGNSTILIEPACEAVITRHGDVKIHYHEVRCLEIGFVKCSDAQGTISYTYAFKFLPAALLNSNYCLQFDQTEYLSRLVVLIKKHSKSLFKPDSWGTL
ncbi:5-oxoprolinase-like [Lingula anatina]|uniref:5-oxoprolinase-like n=1 Tax=Lingula anatina TaxID=7574 RepID=A0A1S3KB17_LINAN|nr:5-oxoprolinase-like [Lingula anatina]|eukprot:XP_013419833.1 5-oxoprolinase-like [Lingula anatina]